MTKNRKPGETARKRGRPATKALEHFLIWAQVGALLKRRPTMSERQACRIIRRRNFPHRTEEAFWQTWLELSRLELLPGAEPGSCGYIEASKYRSKNPARDRMLDFYRRLAFYSRGYGRTEEELAYQKRLAELGLFFPTSGGAE